MITELLPNNVCVITPTGRLDAAGARPLGEELQNQLAKGRVRLVLDMSGTRYISSNGLRIMLRARKDAEVRGGALKLCGLSARLLEIFEMAGFDRVFEIYSTREKASKSFG